MSQPPMRQVRPTVVTAMALHQVQCGLGSTSPHIKDAAESVLSALTLHLRSKQATLPLELSPHMQLLREFNASSS